MSALSPRPRLPARAGSAEHQAAVARRLDLLRAELASTPSSRASPSSPSSPSSLDVDPADRWEQDDPVSSVAAGGGDGAWWDDATRLRPAVHAVASPLADEGLPDPGLPDPGLPDEGLPGLVPVPGRHAARRRVGAVDLVPDTLRGRFAIGPTQLTVVAVVVALGLAVTTWLVVRSSPEPAAVAAPAAAEVVDGEASSDGAALVALEPSPAVDAAPVAATATSGAVVAGSEVTVDVAGKVRRPGIAVLAPGARVVDAIEAAGGARQGVDLTSLNLARPLVDGEQVLVGIDPPPGVAAAVVGGPAPAGTAPGVAGALVDLNAATEAQLDTLPQVGPVTAQSIIAWRDQHGGFTAVDELLEVDGIGEATLAKLAPLVTV